MKKLHNWNNEDLTIALYLAKFKNNLSYSIEEIANDIIETSETSLHLTIKRFENLMGDDTLTHNPNQKPIFEKHFDKNKIQLQLIVEKIIYSRRKQTELNSRHRQNMVVNERKKELNQIDLENRDAKLDAYFQRTGRRLVKA